MKTRSTVVSLLLLLAAALMVVVSCGDEGTDPEAEAEEIIAEWGDGWLDDEPARVVALYPEDGIYADAAYPFELDGQPRVGEMVRGLLSRTDFTTVEPTAILHNDEGAVVQWIWAGTYDSGQFSMEAQTTFVIEDGLITQSTDSYFRPDAPWTGERRGGSSPWEVVAAFGEAAWDGDLDAMEVLLDPEVVRIVGSPGDGFYEELVGRDAVMEAYEREVGPPSPGGHAPAVSTSAEALEIEDGVVTQFEKEATYATTVSDEARIVRLEQT